MNHVFRYPSKPGLWVTGPAFRASILAPVKQVPVTLAPVKGYFFMSVSLFFYVGFFGNLYSVNTSKIFFVPMGQESLNLNSHDFSSDFFKNSHLSL